MYINPPVENLKELQERIESGESFKVFKRWVNEHNRDRSNKKNGFSRIVLQDGTDITVEIFKGYIKNAVATKTPRASVQTQPHPQKPQISFSNVLASMRAMVKDERDNESN